MTIIKDGGYAQPSGPANPVPPHQRSTTGATQPGCRAFQAANRKGRAAGLAGEPVSSCPYVSKAEFEPAFRRAWQAGWASGCAERELRTRNRRQR